MRLFRDPMEGYMPIVTGGISGSKAWTWARVFKFQKHGIKSDFNHPHGFLAGFFRETEFPSIFPAWSFPPEISRFQTHDKIFEYGGYYDIIGWISPQNTV